MKILNNTIQGAVQYSQMGDGDSELLHSGDIEGYIASRGHQTTPEETERMREEQGKLQMVQRALAQAMGEDMASNDRYQSWRHHKEISSDQTRTTNLVITTTTKAEGNK